MELDEHQIADRIRKSPPLCVACWRFHAHGFWWFLSITGVVAALIQIADRVTVYYDAKGRVAEIESELEAHGA